MASAVKQGGNTWNTYDPAEIVNDCDARTERAEDRFARSSDTSRCALGRSLPTPLQHSGPTPTRRPERERTGRLGAEPVDDARKLPRPRSCRRGVGSANCSSANPRPGRLADCFPPASGVNVDCGAVGSDVHTLRLLTLDAFHPALYGGGQPTTRCPTGRRPADAFPKTQAFPPPHRVCPSWSGHQPVQLPATPAASCPRCRGVRRASL